MKTRFFVLVSLLILMISCDGLMGGGSSTSSGSDGLIPDKGEETPVLQPSQQKKKMEDVAVDVINKCSSDDFVNYLEVVERFAEIYSQKDDDYWDVLYEFMDEVARESFKEVYEEHFDEATRKNEIYSAVDIIVMLSNHTGTFVLGENSIAKTSGSGDGVTVKFAMDGKNYEAYIKPSGNVSQAIFNFKSIYSHLNDTYWDDGKYIEGVDVERTSLLNIKIGVPEKIDIALTENGRSLAGVSMKFDTRFTNMGVNLLYDMFDADVTISLNNGYVIKIVDAKYDGMTERTGVKLTLVKDNVSLFTVAVSCGAKLKFIEETYQYDNISEKFTSVELVKYGDFAVAVDVLGQIQVRGKCESVEELIESFNLFEEAMMESNEIVMDRHLNNINAKLDLGVYYDLGTNKQASLELEYEKESNYGWDQNGDGYISESEREYHYFTYPVLVFDDGSRYSVEEYFTEASFSRLLGLIEDFVESYEELVGFSKEKYY